MTALRPALPIWSTFCGVPAAQKPEDYWLWERVLNATRFDLVIELGTGVGGFALFLAAQARSRPFHFLTFDRALPAPAASFQLHPFYEQADMFESATLRKLLEGNVPGTPPILLFCDGGNKRLEVETFSPFLKDGDALAVHDWGTEIDASGIPDGFNHYAGDGMTRFFEKGTTNYTVLGFGEPDVLATAETIR